MEYSFSATFPHPPLFQNLVYLPSIVGPVLGGKGFGLTKVLAYLDGKITPATGKGGLSGGIRGEFHAMDNTLSVDGGVAGDFELSPPNGLALTHAALQLKLNGTMSREEPLLSAIPAVAALNNTPVIGQYIKQLTGFAKFKVELSPSFEATLRFGQFRSGGGLEFAEGTGRLGIDLRSAITVECCADRLKAELWASGGGSSLYGVPAPYLRGGEIHAQFGATFTLDAFIKISKEAKFTFNCSISSSGADCGTGDQFTNSIDVAGEKKTISNDADYPIRIIQPDYEQYGRYSQFAFSSEVKLANAETPVSVEQGTLVSNVFPGASPNLIEIGQGKLLLWEHQNTSLPVLQSTDIAWSLNTNGVWSAPAMITSDTRAELSPVGGVDRNGRAVAAWLRIKDTAFLTPINTTSDLPQFYKKLEAVSAVFDPASRTWGPITQLTDDVSFDTNLRLSSDNSGNLMLSWLSNPNGEFLSTSASPSIMKFSFWNGSNWSSPGIVAGNLVGVGNHAPAIQSTKAFIIVPRDPDSTAENDEKLDLYQWNGIQWNVQQNFATGNVGNIAPSAIYDSSGEGQLVWIRGKDLVHAMLSNPVPRVVRAESASLGFYDAKLLTNSAGNLTLLWRQAIDNGPANIFAVLYDPTTRNWSQDIRFNENSDMSHDLTAHYDKNGRINAAYLSTQISRVSETVTINGLPKTITNIPRNGRTDLRLLEHSLIVDLSIAGKDLVVSTRNPQPGEAVSISATVRNLGDFTVGDFKVSLYTGNPNAGGIVINSQTVTGPFPAGAQRVVTFNFAYPTTSNNLVIIVDPDNGIREFSKANNSATVYTNNSAPQARVIASITNGRMPLTVRFDASESYDIEGDALTFSWAFADGTDGSGIRTSHTFLRSGIYPVTLAVIDARGAISIAVVTITVTGNAASSVSAASFLGSELSAESIVAAFGTSLATSVQLASSVPLPLSLAGTTIRVKDSSGDERLAPLFFVAPTQVNYLIPSGTANGTANVTITSSDNSVSTSEVQIESVAPGIFSANSSGQGVAAAVVLRVKADGSQSYEPVAQSGQAVPIDLGPSGDQVYLLLYGTGFRHNGGINNVKLKIGGVDVPVQYAGIAPGYVGLDQANAGAIPRSLAGRGEVDVALMIDGKAANVVKVNFR